MTRAADRATARGLRPWLDAWDSSRPGIPLVMGILNVTPDSFSDGGRFLEAPAALEHAQHMTQEGADIIDVGGESTRPGSQPVAAEEQIRRVLPVIEGIRSRHPGLSISIDTRSAAVARRALDAGADCVNDVSALGDDAEMAGLVAEREVPVVLMHMKGTPATMQDDPRYEEVVSEVRQFLAERIDFAVRAGIDRRRIIVDPGIGFGKTTAHNLSLLRRLGELRRLEAPLLVGVSRKRMIADVLRLNPADERLLGTAGAVAAAVLNGADIVRVHDVGAMRPIVRLCGAIREA